MKISLFKSSKNKPVKAKLFLLKPSDGTMSPSIDFYFIPPKKTSSSNINKNLDSLKLNETQTSYSGKSISKKHHSIRPTEGISVVQPQDMNR